MAKNSYSRKSNSALKGWLGLVAVILVICAVGFVALFGTNSIGSGSYSDIKLGLDLAGGVSITYRAVDGNPTQEEMNDAIYKLQLRADTYSTEAQVYQQGSDSICVDIPGVSNANEILEELGQPGSLEFVDPDGNVILTGVDVAEAKAGQIQDGNGYVVFLTLTENGAKVFAKETEEHLNQVMSIKYNGTPVSQPKVNSVITGGNCYIEGMTDYDSASKLASVIRIGALPISLEEVKSQVVGATLGSEAISTSIKAGIIGLIVVALIMIAVYLLPGIAAVLALLLYVGLIIVLMSAFDVTLTLPGIAGILLSIGMAVDANVVIFSRIREELAAGKSTRNAIKDGFSKALSAILDGNITTLIAAAILIWRGTGPIKGFAITLAIGIVLSMFTALFVTRFILKAFYNIGLTNDKLYGKKTLDKKINFLSKKNIFFICSLLVIVAGWIGMAVNGLNNKGVLNFSLDFVGGTSTNVDFNEAYTLQDVNDKIIPKIRDIIGATESVDPQMVNGTNEVIFKTRTLTLEERTAMEELFVKDFGVDNQSITAESISATVGKEMKRDAILAVIVATICMLIYIWFRFKDIRFATSAIIAIIHDVLVVLTCYAVFRWSVGNTFIACMLTIVGYTINSTIVIFDRIRENLAIKSKEQSIADVVNTSISQTLGRSILTSLTTFVMVFILFIFGVTDIKEFCMPLMVGIVCGAYSSVCITGALWYLMRTKIGAKAEQAE